LSLAAPRRRRAQTGLAAAFLFATAAALLLLRFPPEQYSFYPQCPIHTYLHLQCPGCGATRALAALLHLHLSDALHANALFVCLLPLALLYALIVYRRALAAQTFRWPRLPSAALFALSTTVLFFTIARNF